MAYKDLDINNTYLVTGAAGFIGFFLSMRLLEMGCKVIGIDNLNNYYDIKLKQVRLDNLKAFDKFTFIKSDISDKPMIMDIFKKYKPDIVINLAAQAGVRYSIENPDAYIQSNIIGFFNILEVCRLAAGSVEHLVYASSSSVYGSNKRFHLRIYFVDNPVCCMQLQKSNELMAHTYSHLYKIPTTGLRFFTVYGPMGRPDMAYFRFADKYFAGEPINIFNNGDFENDLYRDFTYIDDVVEGVVRLLNNPPDLSYDVPYKLYNIGNNKPEKLMVFIDTLEKCLSGALGREVVFEKVFEPMKLGDVHATYASTDLLHEAVGFKPETSIEEGLRKFAEWYVEFYKVR